MERASICSAHCATGATGELPRAATSLKRSADSVYWECEYGNSFGAHFVKRYFVCGPSSWDGTNTSPGSVYSTIAVADDFPSPSRAIRTSTRHDDTKTRSGVHTPPTVCKQRSDGHDGMRVVWRQVLDGCSTGWLLIAVARDMDE